MDNSSCNVFYQVEYDLFEHVRGLLKRASVFENCLNGYKVGMSGFEGVFDTRGLFLRHYMNRLCHLGWTPSAEEKQIILRDRSKDFSGRRQGRKQLVYIEDLTNEELENEEAGTTTDVDESEEIDERDALFYELKGIIQKFEALELKEANGRQIFREKLLENSFKQLIFQIQKRLAQRLPGPDELSGRDRVKGFKHYCLLSFMTTIDLEILLIGLIKSGAALLESPKKKLDLIPIDLSFAVEGSTYKLKCDARDLRRTLGVESTVNLSCKFVQRSIYKTTLFEKLQIKSKNERAARIKVFEIAVESLETGDFTLLEQLDIDGVSYFTGEIKMSLGEEGVYIESGQLEVIRNGPLGWRVVNIDC